MKTFTLINTLCSVFLSLTITCGCKAQDQPALQSKDLDEVSGLVVANKGVIFVHNDSGDSARFFAIDVKGKLLATLNFKGDPAAGPLGVTDCEDMASGPGPEKGKNYLYLGDIGDNGADRPYITVYRFLQPGKLAGRMQLNAEVLHLKYPNGPQDAETMMVDPVSRELVIVSKRQDTVGIYATSLSFKSGDTLVLKKKGSLSLKGSSPAKFVVSGDICSDGTGVLLKTYEKVYYWRRMGNEPVAGALQRQPLELPYTREGQGEAIGFTPDGKGYYCISEGKNAVIYRYGLPGIAEQ